MLIFFKSTKGLSYTLQKEIFCAKVQMHKLGENLQQRFGNQSQRLQSEQPVALFISSHILDILQCTSSTSLQNRQSHNYHNHRSHHLNCHPHLDCRPHHHAFAWKSLF